MVGLRCSLSSDGLMIVQTTTIPDHPIALVAPKRGPALVVLSPKQGVL